MFSKLRARADVYGLGLALTLLAALSIIPMRLAAQGDTTPPTVSLTAPAANAIVADSIAVNATASDNVGVTGVQFRLDGALLGAEDVAAPFAISWSTRGSTDLVFGVSKVVVGPMTIGAGAGFTKRLGVTCSGCTGNDLATEDKVQSAAGPTAATFTYTMTAHYLAQMAAFKSTGTPAYVQGVTATSNSASSTLARAFNLAVSAGNLVVVAVAWQGNSVLRVTDNRGNVYAAATSAYDAVNGQSVAILYAANAAAGATTVMASFGATPTVQRLAIHEYSGMATTSPLDVTATNIANGTTTADNITSGSATTGVMLPVSDGSHTLTAQGRDAAGNIATSVAVPVTVNNAGDAMPPVVSAVTVSSITGSGATINWTTNETSDSQADYGLSTAYGSTSALNASLVTAHTASLSGLTASTLYHVRVRSRDAAGNLGLSGDVTFTTSSGTDVTAPVVSISAPGGGTTVGGVVPVSATASDNVGVVGVQFRVDGALLGAEDVAAPYAIAWSTAGSADLVFGTTKVVVGPMAMTAGSGLTKRLSVTCSGCTGEDLASEDRIQTSAGSTAATWTFSIPAHYLAQMAAFKAVGTLAYVQGATATSNAASSTVAQTFGADVIAGHLVVVAIAWQGNSAVSVTDTRGNVYSVATSAYDAVNGQSLAILYAANTLAGATTVTAGFGGASPTLHRLAIHEYSGVATTSPLDGTAANIADGTTTADAITSGSAPTTVPAPVTPGSHTLTAVARDAAGNTTTSVAVTVTVNNAGDTTPPVISGVAAASITSSGATINWTTDEASDSQVDYGLTTAYGTSSALNASQVTSHSIALNGVAMNTLYHYRARSRDAAGNLALSGDFTFTTMGDVTSPTVSISAPGGGATVTGAVMVTASASDNVGVMGVQFRLDGAVLGAEDMGAPYAQSWDTRTATVGSHTLTAVARDSATNQTTSATVSVTVANDTTPPVISGATVSSITGSGATINWTTNEASDSQADYGLTTAYGSTSALNASLVTAHTASLSGLTASTLYHGRVRSRDTAGNLALSGDVTFTTLSATDVTAPVVSISAPGGGTTVGGAVPVSATASDNVGITGVQFKVDGALLGSEDVAAPYAIAWNTTGSADLVFGVTKVVVGPMTMTPGSGLTKRLSATCGGCPTGEDLASEDKIQTSAGPTVATWTFSMAAHYLAQMAAFTAAGTPAYVQGTTATSNSTSPTIAQTFGANVVAGHLVVVAIAWQGNSAVSVTDTRGNVYRVATSAYDAVNGQSLAILYAANTLAGATTVTASFGGASPTLHRLAIHEYSGVATASPLDGTAANIAEGTTTANAITSGAAPTTVTAPVTTGSHTLTAVARDAAGNTATSAAVTVTVNNGDITPPVISGVAAASITSSGATINWTTNEASDSQVDYGLTTAYGSTSPLNGSFVTTHSVILGALAGNTTYHVRARSKDAAGNLALSPDFAFATVAMDSSLPVVSITAPAAGATVSGTTTFSATATDNVGVAGVEFKRDGVLIAPEDTAAPYSVPWNTTTATAGTHTLTAVAWDAAGNSATATRTVTVSNPLATVQLAWNANTEADLAGYKVYVGTSSGVYSTSYNVGNAVTYTVAGLSPGNVYYFVVTAYDTTSFESLVSNEVSATK